jgi:AcrR family transcriptional regulator
MTRDERSTKEKLLREARDLYLEVGPTAFSLREVARRTGLTAAAVYRHYDGKEALLGAVAEEGFRLFGSYLLGTLAKRRPVERLRAAGDQYLRFGLEQPRDYRVIFMSDVLDHAETGPATSATFGFLVDRVRECVDAKAFAPGDPVEIATMIWAHVHGLVSLRLAGHLTVVGDDAAFSAVFRRSVDRLLAGLRR